MQLVQAGAPAKDKLVAQEVVLVNLDQDATEQQVLLDLRWARPRRLGAPRGDERGRDHRSGSTSVLTTMSHVGSVTP